MKQLCNDKYKYSSTFIKLAPYIVDLVCNNTVYTANATLF